WLIKKELEKEESLSLSKKLNLSPILIQLLYNRNIPEDRVEEFFHPSLKDLHNPFLMKGMRAATQRILEAISHQEKILIYGDYDVDGITATSLLLLFLREVGIPGYFYIPHRREEGYGLNNKAVEKIAGKGIDLVITCDCGISSVKEIEYAKTLGLEVIVTDHHQIKESLPPSLAIINPHQPDCPYPFKELAGVGVAFKLVQALAHKILQKNINIQKYLDLVAMGTIADSVSLRDENRTVVKLGLQCLEKTSSIGLKALMNVANLSGEKVKENNVGFILAPRLNACGRLSLAKKGVKLLLSTSPEEAFNLAEALDKENRERQKMEERMCKEAEELLLKRRKERVIILSKKGWHKGVIGLVASYIREKYFRPAIIFSLDNKVAKGSARSIPTFSIFDALKKCEDLLISFGGHKMAAGMRASVDNIEKLRKRINELAKGALSPEDLVPSYYIDACVRLDDLNEEFFDKLECFSPYGPGNPSPLLLARKVSILSPPQTIGREGLKMVIGSEKEGGKFEGIGFGLNNGDR
ncbi:MAG: single-stranded-DNA-specific exonuclease RecJ, partial [Candidatus Aerophobetes bacterium]|nr:single-stranded-DNA-specific exonuclease RecJ [Candidatus Aerophobetes bacterium]